MTRTPQSADLRRALGAALARYRKGSPLDQTALGRATNYSRTSISHIEAGRQFPGREFWKAADDALSAGGDLLAHFDRVGEQERQLKIAQLRRFQVARTERAADHLRPPSSPHDGDGLRDDVNRRELLRLMSVAGGLLSVPALDAERMAHADAVPRNLAPATVDGFERVNAALWQQFSGARTKAAVLPAAHEHLAALAGALGEPQRLELRRRLCALAGDLFQLCGEIFFDVDRYGDAAHCYAQAAHASKEAREFDLWACAMTRTSFLSLYEGRYRDAAAVLDKAAGLAARGDRTRTARHWVAAVQAQAQAGLGDLPTCQRSLDNAENAAQAPAQQHTGWLRFDGSRVDEERGSCYVALRKPELAEPVLNKALARAGSGRRRGSVLADLATTGAQRGDVDQLLMNGAAALDTARHTSSAGYLGRKLGTLRAEMRPYLNDRHVRHLDDQIRRTITPAQ